MSRTVTIQLEKPITSAKVLGNYPAGIGTKLSGEAQVNLRADAEQVKLMQDLDTQRAEFSQVCQVLKGLVDKLNQFHNKIFAEHGEQIAKLSVEIARKVLVQKVQERDYEIESIVKEVLRNAPTHQDLVVHLNPEDLVQCQKLQQDDATGTLADIKFIGDSNIGRAECLLETPKGVIKSLIDEHLEQIGKELEKVE